MSASTPASWRPRSRTRTRRSCSAGRPASCSPTRAAWGSPNSDSHNFGGVELYQTNGFGENRDARRATALGQLEDKVGETGLWRLTTGVYATEYHTAGVIRQDDYDAGRIGFYDTYAPFGFGQGGTASRA